MEERRNSSPLRCCLIHYGWLFFHRPVTTGERKELQKEPFSPLFSLGLEGRQSEDRQSLKFFPRGRLRFLLPPPSFALSRTRRIPRIKREEKKTAIFIARNRSEDFSPRPFIFTKSKRDSAPKPPPPSSSYGAMGHLIMGGPIRPSIDLPLSLPSLLGNDDPAAHLSCRRLSSDSLGLFVTPALTWLSLLLFLIVFLCLVSPAVPGRTKAHSCPSLPSFPPEMIFPHRWSSTPDLSRCTGFVGPISVFPPAQSACLASMLKTSLDTP